MNTRILEEKEYWKKHLEKCFYHALKDDPFLMDAPEHIKKDEELALFSITKGERVRHLHSDLLNDKKFILKLIEIEKTPTYIHYPKHIQEDVEIIHACYVKDPHMVGRIPSSYRNKEFYSMLLNINGLGYQHMIKSFSYPDKYEDDWDLAKLALENKPEMIEFVIRKFRTLFCQDEHFVKRVIEEAPQAFKFLSRKVRNNPIYAIPAIEKIPDNLEFALDKIKNNREYVLHLVKNYDCKVYHASEELQLDEEIQLEKIKHSGFNYTYIPNELQKNYQFACKALYVHRYVYDCLPDSFKETTPILLALCSHLEGRYKLPESIKKEIGDEDPVYYLTQKALKEKLLVETQEKQVVSKMKI